MKATTRPRATLARIDAGLRLVTVPFPQLAGLVAATRVTLDARLPTMGVFASGRLAVNAEFVARLNEADLTFVLAHEMLHLALRTHDRARGASRLEYNLAHDYIINDMLRAELGVSAIPADGLDMPGARHRSAEEIVLELRRKSAVPPKRVWEATRATGGADNDGDVLADELERQWYPQDAAAQAASSARMKDIATRALALGAAMDALRGARGTRAAGRSATVTALRGIYRTPWQLALARWIEAVAPGDRSFARPSRRSSPSPDVVLAGRRREGWLLNVVLDTSASMTDDIPRALGALADFCDAAGVDQIRLLQCDAEVASDAYVEPAALAQHEVRGFGGSDLTPALQLLADDAQTRAVLVVTDGDIAYPPDRLPFDVLWVLPTGAGSGFRPPYGRVLTMD